MDLTGKIVRKKKYAFSLDDKQMLEMKPFNLLGADRNSMEDFFHNMGEANFRSSQVIQWIHQLGVIEFEKMTNLSKDLRKRLGEKAIITAPTVISEKKSVDGTLKWMVQLEDGNIIETVYIPEPARGTLCISSQAGCQLNCTFCATAQQGFSRQLETSEIIGQLWLASRRLSERDRGGRAITNIVMMGMGEPLLNAPNVIPAIRLMLDNNSYNLSRKRVTVSTAGVIPGIDLLKRHCLTSLAISLHAPNDELRNKLVPLNKKYPLQDLLEACKRYSAADNYSEITFEYVMIKDLNDRTKHARSLLNLLSSVPAKINLIPYNEVPGIPHQRSDESSIDRFRETLLHGGMVTTTRKTRGEDISAACGQLAGSIKRKIGSHQKLSVQRASNEN